jgi:hypothetical protein
MNISFKFKHIAGKASQKLGLLLWAMLGVVILLEGLVINQSVHILLYAKHVEPTPATQLVRINFGLYDSIVKRLTQQGAFTPTPVAAKNPFGTLETAVKK